MHSSLHVFRHDHLRVYNNSFLTIRLYHLWSWVNYTKSVYICFCFIKKSMSLLFLIFLISNIQHKKASAKQNWQKVTLEISKNLLSMRGYVTFSRANNLRGVVNVWNKFFTLSSTQSQCVQNLAKNCSLLFRHWNVPRLTKETIYHTVSRLHDWKYNERHNRMTLLFTVSK